ncbi:MAG: S-methyl-5'-thioadenosine phosphorylase [Chloroflexi bacterium HGW-Chloroflexi-10]|nr:MAG: S-methyl-5'-thioadenosine phosphorylase [Chloroflexi bacterium HGW-Chloroflexi-10]
MQNFPILGIIGGTGVYQFDAISDLTQTEVSTPFGKPSSPVMTGTLAGKKVAFLARHGLGHNLSPTEVNYRANIFALKSMGIRHVISISACGSLRHDFAPGDIVIPDQLVDFTKSRKNSFFEGGLVAHVGTADPFCAHLSSQLFEAVQPTGANIHMGGTFVTIEGPRFSTKAESNLFRSWGMSIIGMTASPEAFLAREAEMCYAAFAHVTDYDVWHQTEDPVTVEMIIKILHRNAAIAQSAIVNLVSAFEPQHCECQDALKTALTTSPEAVDHSAKQKLGLLVEKYLP